jgi:hypothetical protein
MVSEFIFLYIEDCISVLTSSVVDLWFEPQLGQTKYSKIWNCSFPAKHTALLSKGEKTCHSTFLCYKNICVTAERCKNMYSKNTNMDTQWCLLCPCSLLNIQHYWARATTGWFGIRVMCLSGMTCVPMDCCFSEVSTLMQSSI